MESVKILIECGSSPRPGWLNLASRPVPDDQGKPIEGPVVGDWRNLDHFGIEEESAEQIVAYYALHRLNPQEVMPVLSGWVQKVSPGGMLTMVFRDIRLISQMAHRFAMDLSRLHEEIYGKDSFDRSICDAATMKNALMNLGLSIETISFDDTTCVIEARKLKGEIL